MIAPNERETAVARCILVQGEETIFRPQACFVFTAGQGEIVVFKVTPNGSVVFICSNARSG